MTISEQLRRLGIHRPAADSPARAALNRAIELDRGTVAIVIGTEARLLHPDTIPAALHRIAETPPDRLQLWLIDGYESSPLPPERLPVIRSHFLAVSSAAGVWLPDAKLHGDTQLVLARCRARSWNTLAELPDDRPRPAWRLVDAIRKGDR